VSILRKSTDVTPVSNKLYFLPVETRVPLKFGPEPLTYVTCARVQMRVKKADGQISEGWGETPLSVQWVWPSQLTYQKRHEVLKRFCLIIAKAWANFDFDGHAMEIGYAFQKEVLPVLLVELNQQRGEAEAMPWLAALVCCSAFDIALHDAYGVANQKPVYQTYAPPYMEADLSNYWMNCQGKSLRMAIQFC